MGYGTKKTYFRGSRKHGRTTTLIDTETGEELDERMGAVSKAKMIKMYKGR